MAWSKNTENTEHTYVAERLCAYLDGELTAQEKASVERHLPECPHCQWELQTLRQTVQWMQEMPAVPLPCSFAIPVPARQKPRWSWTVPVMQRATALVAAMLLLVVAGDFLLTGGLGSASAPAALPVASTSDAAMQEAALEAQPTEEVVAFMVAPSEEAAVEPEAAVEVESLMVTETAVVEEQVVEAPNAKVGGEALPRAALEEQTQTPPPEFGTMSAAEVFTPTEGLGGGLEPGEAEVPVTEAEVASDTVAAPPPPTEEAASAPALLPTSPVTTLDAPPAEPTPQALAAAPEEERAAAPAEKEAESGQRAGSERQPLAFWLDAAKVGLSIFLVLLLASTLILTSLRRRTG